ncbi:MAG: hypothetical protein J6Q69_07305 [Clostridia bacterium]|nr:hypothetical protein [Clostridia bacterium]
MTAVNAYEKLYMNMKNKFTVVNDNCEYTLGEYMSMKADAKANKSGLPATSTAKADTHSISAIFSYVNDKLTVKKAPVKDKTMRRFPMRTALASFFSAAVACAFIFSFGMLSMNSASSMPSTVEADESIVENVEMTNVN